MSIMIKDIDMPKNCYSCWLGHKCPKYEALLWNEISKERKADCPLIELPPHGRLIDADELLRVAWESFDVVPRWMVKEAPTVIPADKDGEA